MKSFDLVGPQFGANAERDRRRDACLEFSRAPVNSFNVLFGQELARRLIGQLQRVEPLGLGGKIP